MVSLACFLLPDLMTCIANENRSGKLTYNANEARIRKIL